MELVENTISSEAASRTVDVEHSLKERQRQWFDQELQACAIENIARSLSPNQEDWDDLDSSAKNQLRIHVVTSGFTAWYRDEKISQQFTENQIEFSKIAALYERYKDVDTSRNSNGEMTGRIALMRALSEFSERVSSEWLKIHPPKNTPQH